jgi:hypothetical protein
MIQAPLIDRHQPFYLAIPPGRVLASGWFSRFWKHGLISGLGSIAGEKRSP